MTKLIRSCLCLGKPVDSVDGGGGGGGDDLMWQTDLKSHAFGNYSIAVVQANANLEDQSQVFTSPSATYVGVYDGHGGPEAARFVNQNLFTYLHKFTAEHGRLSEDVIKKAFRATEDEFLQLVDQLYPSNPHIASVGSCCLVGAISDGILYIANLGDSRVVLGKRVSDKKTQVVAERVSKDYNVANQEVRKEVEALHPDDPNIVVYTRGAWRIKGIIQVSRSIGDVYLKKPVFHKSPAFQKHGYLSPLKRAVVTAEPSVLARKLSPQDLFLIFASDGLWEQLSDETAVEIVVKHPRAGIARRLVEAAVHEAAKKRELGYDNIKAIRKGIRRHFHDDITVIVVYLDRVGAFCSLTHHVRRSSIGCTVSPIDIYTFNAEDNHLE